MKKLAALFCASCMVVTALAGCGKGNFTDSRNWKCSHDGEGGRVRFGRTHRTDYDGLYRPALGNLE